MCFSMPECKAHLITETYVEVGNIIFIQCIGIPMGIWANLHHYKYESDQITQQFVNSDKTHGLNYRHATRFIDDECNLNDPGDFGRSFHLIYPSSTS